MIGGRRPLPGRKLGDRRVRVERPHSQFFRWTGPGTLVARPQASVPRSAPGRAWARVKALAIGRPLASEEEIGERVSKTKGLAVFSSDAISSSTYASEEILRILVVAGGAALFWGPPVALAIALLLLIVATSYRQVCYAYPSGGGAYAVARANLNRGTALIAAAALLFDYTVTVSVSTAAGIAAIVSFVPELMPWRAELGVLSIALLALANLRGLRESGNLFAAPTYLYVVGAVAILAIGLVQIASGNPAVTFTPAPLEAPPEGWQVLSVLLVVRAFAFGSVALTGTEAITNGVPAFKPPEPRNAANTMTVMAILLGVIFVGLSLLAWAFGITPDMTEQETLISQVTRAVIGSGPAYVAFQVVTTLILILAANTGFNGAPRLARILAVDGYAPRQFALLGDRLAYSWGIIVLAIVASVLVLLFDGSVAGLIPLYSIGIFLSFSISQAGMVIHWRHERVPGRAWKLALNFVGMTITGTVWVIITFSKFTAGAWIWFIALPLLVMIMIWTHREYRDEERDLEVPADAAIPPPRRDARVVVAVDGINRAAVRAVNIGRTLGDDLRAVYMTDDADEGDALRERWQRQLPDVPLVIVETPYRAVVGPFVAYLDVLEQAWPPDREQPTTIVVLPEYVGDHWWERILYNSASRRLRAALTRRDRTIVADVPYRRDHPGDPPA